MQRLEPEQIENQTFPVSRRGYDTEKVDGFLQVVAAYYREAIRRADARVDAPAPARAPSPAPAPESAPAQPFEQLGEQVAAVLSTAARAAEDLTRNAERDAQRMKKAAATEAAETTQAASTQLAAARQATTDAEKQAEATLAQASEEATRLRQDAHAVAARLEENARERAAKLEQAASAKVASILAEARRRYDDLRRMSRQSASHLESVEAVLRKAREELVRDQPQLQIPDQVDVAAEQERANAPAAAKPAAPSPAEPAAKPATQRGPNGAPEPDAPTNEMIAEVLEPRLTKRKKPAGPRAPGAGKSSGQNSVKQ